MIILSMSGTQHQMHKEVCDVIFLVQMDLNSRCFGQRRYLQCTVSPWPLEYRHWNIHCLRDSFNYSAWLTPGRCRMSQPTAREIEFPSTFYGSLKSSMPPPLADNNSFDACSNSASIIFGHYFQNAASAQNPYKYISSENEWRLHN